jgi:hypothetical protein
MIRARPDLTDTSYRTPKSWTLRAFPHGDFGARSRERLCVLYEDKSWMPTFVGMTKEHTVRGLIIRAPGIDLTNRAT